MPAWGRLFFLAYNGAFAGALAGYLTERGLSSTFYSFVATHSAFELTAIVLSGAAGLRIGHALLAPGRLTRRQSLVLATRDSAVLLYGVTAMLLVAAAVEAFWSSATWLPPAVKYGVAALCWTAVLGYFAFQGRRAALTRWRVRLRPRTPMEAADLGVRLCQSAARSVYRCYLIVALPVVALVAGLVRDRQLAADAGDLVREAVARSHDPVRAVARRLRAAHHACRRVAGAAAGVVEPVAVHVDGPAPVAVAIAHAAGVPARRAFDLEGGRACSPDPAAATPDPRFMMTQAFNMAEIALTLALVSLVFWLAPSGRAPDLLDVLSGEVPAVLSLALPVAYAIAVLFLEPFYVAAGFAMYLNRRAELEAWDIEQEFRRAFAH